MTHIMQIPLQYLLSATIPVQSFHPHHPITCVTETQSIFTCSIPQPLTLVSSTILSSPSYSISSQVIAVTKAGGRGKVLNSAPAVSIHSRLKVVAVTVAPSFAASSGEPMWSRPIWPQLVKFSYRFFGILQVAGWLPGRCIIALPLNKILESVVEVSAIKYLFNLPLLLSINYNW